MKIEDGGLRSFYYLVSILSPLTLSPGEEENYYAYSKELATQSRHGISV